jgi:SPP1 family predicted phage head-tail adaptor
MAGIGSMVKQKCSDMRHRITVQSPVETQDATGQPVVAWTNFVTDEPARFRPMGGTEVMRGRQLEAGTKGVFNINYRDGLTTKMRIVHNGTEYGIANISEVDGIRRNLEIMVKSA